MCDESTNPIGDRAIGGIVGNAFMRWESGLTIVLTAILFFFDPAPFTWWQPWFWLVAGAIAEVALVISVITDPEAASQAMSREFDAKYDLREIKSSESRQRLQSAKEYRRSMLALVKRHRGAMHTSLTQTVNAVNDWIDHMYDLALHIDAFDNNELVGRDRKIVPQQIEETRININQERDPSVLKALKDHLKQLEQQNSNLKAIDSSVATAKIQLKNTLSSLGTVYAQISLLNTKEVDSSRAQRLRLEIQDEVSSLQDTIETLNELRGALGGNEVGSSS